jgi:hypothetical protein
MVFGSLSPNGASPVSTKTTMAAREKQSAGASCGSPRSCSGGENAGVPDAPGGLLSVGFAMPKSAIRHRRYRSISRFSGLRSRWNDPHRVRRGEPAQYAVDLRRDLGDRPRARPFDEIADGAIFGELHGVPGHVAAAVPVVDRDDRGMRELRRQPSLATEPPDRTLIARDVRVQQLERHLASEREVAHAPHRAEASRTERRDHLVVVGERPSKPDFGRLARRGGVLAAQREHRATADDAVHGADHRRDAGEALGRITVKRLVHHLGDGRRHVGAHEDDRRERRCAGAPRP